MQVNKNDLMSSVSNDKSDNTARTINPMDIIAKQKELGLINSAKSSLQMDSDLANINATPTEALSTDEIEATNKYLNAFDEQLDTSVEVAEPQSVAYAETTVENTESVVMSSFELPKELTQKPMETKSNLPNLTGKINLAGITINKDLNQIELVRNAKNILSIDSTFQVLMLQSGYMGEISALNNHELRAMTTNVTDYYSLKDKSFKTIFNHMMSTSIGSITYETFLKITSYFDQNTLYFGAFAKTFPGRNKYTVYCSDPNCKGHNTGFEAEIHNNNLVRLLGDESKAYEKRNEILERARKPEDLVGRSLVHTIKRIMLQDCNFIIDLRIPSLHDYLTDALYSKDPKYVEEYQSELGVAFFVDQILVPNIEKWNGGDPSSIEWLPIKDKNEKVSYICKFQPSDYNQLVTEIDEFANTYKVDYALQHVTCPFCKRELGDVEVNMEDVLFTLTNTRRQTSKTE